VIVFAGNGRVEKGVRSEERRGRFKEASKE